MVKQVDILAFGKMKSRIMAEIAILTRRLLAFDNFFMVFKDSEKKCSPRKTWIVRTNNIFSLVLYICEKTMTM